MLARRLDALPGPAEQFRSIEELAEAIFRRVDDPRLRRSPCLNIARAVVEGEVDPGLLMRALARLDELRAGGQLTSPPSAYFNGAVKRLLSKRRSLR